MNWSSHGVSGPGFKPDMAGTIKGGALLVCGSGRTLWEDLIDVGALAGMRCDFEAKDILCCNVAGCHFPRPFGHWASMHPEHLPHWAAVRRRDWPGSHIVLHAPGMDIGIEQAWPLDIGPGCTGLFAALIGLAMGYERVVLAGVPEDNLGHFYDPPGSAGTYMGGDDDALALWTHCRDEIFDGRVKSLSGKTREILGTP